MSTNRSEDDPALADRAWSGYHPRAAVPVVAVAAVAVLVVWTGKWYLDDLSALAQRIGALALFVIEWSVLLAVVAIYLYRAVTYTYHLTDQAILVDFGFWHRPAAPVWLREVTDVRSGGGVVQRLLGVGWVEVRTATRAVRLVGVRRAEEFARQIRAAVDESRSRSPA